MIWIPPPEKLAQNKRIGFQDEISRAAKESFSF